MDRAGLAVRAAQGIAALAAQIRQVHRGIAGQADGRANLVRTCNGDLEIMKLMFLHMTLRGGNNAKI